MSIHIPITPAKNSGLYTFIGMDRHGAESSWIVSTPIIPCIPGLVGPLTKQSALGYSPSRTGKSSYWFILYKRQVIMFIINKSTIFLSKLMNKLRSIGQFPHSILSLVCSCSWAKKSHNSSIQDALLISLCSFCLMWIKLFGYFQIPQKLDMIHPTRTSEKHPRFLRLISPWFSNHVPVRFCRPPRSQCHVQIHGWMVASFLWGRGDGPSGGMRWRSTDFTDLPSGKHTKNDAKSPSLVGKSTFAMGHV